MKMEMFFVRTPIVKSSTTGWGWDFIPASTAAKTSKYSGDWNRALGNALGAENGGAETEAQDRKSRIALILGAYIAKHQRCKLRVAAGFMGIPAAFS